MIGKNRIIAFSFTFLVTTLILLSFTLSSNAQTLYSCEAPFDESDNFLHTIDPNTGATLSTVEIRLNTTRTVNGCNGMAQDPTTGVCYLILNDTEPEENFPRVLAIVDPITGRAIEIGNTGNAFSDLTFDSSGTLYGITGDGAPSFPETLFTLNKNTAQPTFVQTLGNGDQGEAIAFNPNDGLIYHASGTGALNDPVGGEIFESVNPITGVVTLITISGDTSAWGRESALVHQSGNVFLAVNDNELNSITTGGVVTDLDVDLDHSSHGLAFDCVIPPPAFLARPIPTLSEWGLIAMAGVLGLIGLLAIRRRKALA